MDPLEIICLHEELYACQPLALTPDRQPRVLQLPDKMCAVTLGLFIERSSNPYNAFFRNLRCSAYMANLVQCIEWPFEDGALQDLISPCKALYTFDRTVSQHLSYVCIAAVPLECVHLYCGIAALAALPLWRHCRFGRHCRCDEFRRCHVLTLPSRVQTTACKQRLILAHLRLNISKTIYRQASIISFKGMPWRGCVRCSATAARHLHRLILT